MSGSLFDRVIDVIFYDDSGKELFAINTPRCGLKPKIEFSYSRVPENFCYKLKLAITNCYCQLDIVSFASLKVTIGYSSDTLTQLESISGQIFHAYRRTPSPDSQLVFECIVARASNILDATGYWLRYFSSATHTVEEVLAKVQEKSNFKIDMQLNKLKGMTWSNTDIDQTFYSGMNLIVYVTRRLSELAKSVDCSIQTTIFSDKITFTEFNTRGNVAQDIAALVNKVDIPALDRTLDVTWTAGTLSVIAPYDPRITPATYFYCSPTIYNGATLPRDIQVAKGQKSKYDLYYVIKQDVEFSTVDDINRMSLLAVPVENSPANTEVESNANLEYVKYSSDYLAELEESNKRLELELRELFFGAAEEAPVEAVFELNYAPNSYVKYQIRPGDTLSMLASGRNPKGVKLSEDSALASLDSIKPLDFYQTPVCGTLKTGQKFESPNGIPGYFIGYPLILEATYRWYVKGNKEFEIDPNNPDLLTVGNYLIIPVLNKYSELKNSSTIVSILDKIITYYEKVASKKNWIQNTKILRDMIKEGTIDD